MTVLHAVDPRTGEQLEPGFAHTADAEVDTIVAAAAAASREIARRPRSWRADMLEEMAAALDADGAGIVATAAGETGFGEQKLVGELARTVFQLRFFAEVVRDGGFLEATIDRAGDTPMGPRPDLRRLLVPIGPVAVFGASNFPLAFSVPGGDTASALASGCAVVAKAHSSHPATSARSLAALRSGAERVGAPPGTVALVFGTAAGRRLVAHPAIAAVGFTGSLSGGRALLDVIATRDEPIPFYGELSSLNPVVVTPAAAAERGADIGAGLVASVAVGSGQLCTKPGIVLVPGDAGGEALVEAARSAVGEIAEAVLLNGRIRDEYVARTEVLTDLTTATLGSEGPTGAGFQARPAVFETTLADFRPEMGEEVFGPATLVVRYPPDALVRSVSEVLDLLPSSLTATVHRGTDEDVTGLVPLLADRAGRLVFDGYPTGVAVSWAQTHGGPWPSTNALHTSVGATSTRRFLRPVTYQNAPSSVLPVELLDDVHEVPRRVDGVLELAEGAA